VWSVGVWECESCLAGPHQRSALSIIVIQTANPYTFVIWSNSENWFSER